MKWVKILDITRDCDCHHFEFTLGIYENQPRIHFSDVNETEEPQIVKLIITDNQLKGLRLNEK